MDTDFANVFVTVNESSYVTGTELTLNVTVTNIFDEALTDALKKHDDLYDKTWSVRAWFICTIFEVTLPAVTVCGSLVEEQLR